MKYNKKENTININERKHRNMTPIETMRVDINEKLDVIVKAETSGEKNWEFTMLNEMDSIVRRLRVMASYMKKTEVERKEKTYTKFSELF